MPTQKHLSLELKIYLEQAFKRIYMRRQKLGLLDPQLSEKQVEQSSIKEMEEFCQKVEGFIIDHQDMCSIWNSQEVLSDRLKELEIYGKVRLYESNCIDGRICKVFKGEAEVIKTEKAVFALDIVYSNGKFIPRGTDVCFALDNTSQEPLVLALAHFDSLHSDHGCAAMDLVLKDPLGNIEQVWRYLSPDEKNLVFQARSRSVEEANIVLAKLTTSRAVTNYTNDRRAEKNLQPLERVSIAALYDTRTMGIILKAPIFDINEDVLGIKLAPENRDYLSTTELALELRDLKDSSLPEFGIFLENFTDPDNFENFSKAVTDLAIQMFKMDSGVKKEIEDFIDHYYNDLTPAQKNALSYRLCREIAHQYLTGLAIPREKHPFSEHEEKYISASSSTNYFGKFDLDDQNFIVNIPDADTGAKRIDIGALVMDKTGVDSNTPHALFIATSLNAEVYKNRASDEFRSAYEMTVKNNTAIFRRLNSQSAIISRVSNGNLVPIGLLLDEKTGEVLQVIEENYHYL